MSAKHDDSFLLVNDAYSSFVQTDATTVAQPFGYTVEQLQSAPVESHMGLGCGNPTVTATLKPGEIVLDLGSGGGIDRGNAAERGYFPPAVCFVVCSLTDTLPIKSNSINCVLSNWVINLLPPSGKTHIFGEIYRLLKPGGRVVLVDILVKEELPPHIRDDMKQYVSCIGGAVEVHEYDSLLTTAGSNAASGSTTSARCAPSSIPTDAKEVDLNHWAALVGRLPHANIERLSPPDLATLLRKGVGVKVIVVRSGDRSGGHLKGNHARPAQTFHTQLTSFHRQFATARGRGPRCAGWQALVRVLDGGMHAGLEAYSADVELTEGFLGEGETASFQRV
ncbi:S-adenosyl-L-methionine-dependent methyltransferase [Mycena belliarum]|uniref:Arsenite methyltransferase n=1 Tax=Mycena belliarum TaxID=1033014 RepID=A0AAD6XPR1_9AGAR|nr:S-adenosyl-L-methionine-dependent methyltransferase [Mycena belliae]